jgi:hypothetical protein
MVCRHKDYSCNVIWHDVHDMCSVTSMQILIGAFGAQQIRKRVHDHQEIRQIGSSDATKQSGENSGVTALLWSGTVHQHL